MHRPYVANMTTPNRLARLLTFRLLPPPCQPQSLGNIAGVAIAIGRWTRSHLYDPGRFFRHVLQVYRMYLGSKVSESRKDGRIMGGAMHYLSQGLLDRNLADCVALTGLFCLLCIGGSLGGGNSFQVVQSLDMIKTVLPALAETPWIYGLLMAILVGLVILGGIKSIARVASFIVPIMCCIYLLACLYILGTHFSEIPAAFSPNYQPVPFLPMPPLVDSLAF